MDQSLGAVSTTTANTEHQSRAVDHELEQPKSTCYPNWTPPLLPPHDLIDVEAMAEDIKKKWFKADYVGGFLYDETRQNNLPVDSKGFLIVDPVTRTRLEDAYIEHEITVAYFSWIDATMAEVKVGNPNGAADQKQTLIGLAQLRETLMEDSRAIDDELMTIVEGERKRRGLSGFGAWVANFNKHIQAENGVGMEDCESCDGVDYSLAPSSHGDIEDHVDTEDISKVNSLHIISHQPPSVSSLEEAIIQHQTDEITPLIPHTENESIQAYCCGCCVS